MSLTSYRAAPSRGKAVALVARTRYLATAAGLGKGARRGKSSYFPVGRWVDGAERGHEPDSSPRDRFRARRATAGSLGRGPGGGAPRGRRAGGRRRHLGARIPQGDEALARDPAPLRAHVRRRGRATTD